MAACKGPLRHMHHSPLQRKASQPGTNSRPPAAPAPVTAGDQKSSGLCGAALPLAPRAAAEGAAGTATPAPLSWFSRSATAGRKAPGSQEQKQSRRSRWPCGRGGGGGCWGGAPGTRAGAELARRAACELAALRCAGVGPQLHTTAGCCCEKEPSARAVPPPLRQLPAAGGWQRLPALSAVEMVFFRSSFSLRNTSSGWEDSPSARGATRPRAALAPAAAAAAGGGGRGGAGCGNARPQGDQGACRCAWGARGRAQGALAAGGSHRGGLSPRAARRAAAMTPGRCPGAAAPVGQACTAASGCR